MMKMFNGEINGKKLNDFNGVNYSVEKLEDRMNYISEVVEEGEFFTTYFDEYYDARPNQNGYLAEENAVCKRLEAFGTYLLDSKDVASNRDKKELEERTFWKNEKDFKKYKESQVQPTLNASTDDGEGNSSEMMETISHNGIDKNKKECVKSIEEEIEDILAQRAKEKNQKVVKPVFVTSDDKKMIEEIKELENYINFISSNAGRKHILTHIQNVLETATDPSIKRRCENIERNVDRYRKNLIKDMRANQLAIKEIITRPVDFKDTLKDEGVDKDWSLIDLGDSKQVRMLLESLHQRDLNGSEFQQVLWDLHRFIETGGVKLSKKQVQIFELLANGWKQQEIVDEYGWDKGNVSRELTKIAVKIGENLDYDI